MRMSRRMAITSPWSSKIYGGSWGPLVITEIEKDGFTVLQTDICYDPLLHVVYMIVLYRRGTSTSSPPDASLYAVTQDGTLTKISSMRIFWASNDLLPQTKAISSLQLGAFYRSTSIGTGLPAGYYLIINYTFSDGVHGYQLVLCTTSASGQINLQVKNRYISNDTLLSETNYSTIVSLYGGTRWIYSVSNSTVVLYGWGDGYTSKISVTLPVSNSDTHLYAAGKIEASSGQGLLVLSNDDYVTWRDAYLPDATGWATPIKYSDTDIFRVYSASYDYNTKKLTLACEGGFVVIDTTTKTMSKWVDSNKSNWHAFNAPTGFFAQDNTSKVWRSSTRNNPPGDIIQSTGVQKLSINKSVCAYSNNRVCFIWTFPNEGPCLMSARPSQKKAW